MEKPEIEYPCIWSYRTIGSDHDSMMKEIPLKLGTIPHTITPGNQSSKGNYCSLNVDATVQSEMERHAVTTLLKSVSGVKMVL
jgi:uncharacterized protein